MDNNLRDNYRAKFNDLEGKTLKEITGKVGDETMQLITDSGEIYQLSYYSDCCASCSVEEIHGDLTDLIGTPILLAEEISHCNENPPEVKAPGDHGSFTWTFYKLSTISGSVTIRWYGTSNGYYSESVTFEKLG